MRVAKRIHRSFIGFFAATVLLAAANAQAIVINTTVPSVGISGLNKVVDIVPGGLVTGNVSGSGLYHDISLLGGSVLGNISFSGFEHVFNFFDGNLGGNLTFSGFDHIVNITGGTFGGGMSGSGERHIFNITGFGLTSTRAVGSLISGVSMISGTLADGNAFNYNISIGGTYTVNLINQVPVPSTLALVGLLLLGLGRARRLR